ncbi:MAG: hypothetical protein PUB87_07720 [Eubacteriaceae bacterium]|nr:hypothetical protein [Eubacteriaceae bacterium]
MDKISGQLIVYFDGMYWSGLFERIENNRNWNAKSEAVKENELKSNENSN